MSDNDWLFDEAQAARIRRLVTPDDTGSFDVPGPATVRRLLDALANATARAEASEARIAELVEWNRCEVAFREADTAVWHDRLKRSEARLAASEREAARLRAALQWYADSLNYDIMGAIIDGFIDSRGQLRREGIRDMGKRARAALSVATLTTGTSEARES